MRYTTMTELGLDRWPRFVDYAIEDGYLKPRGAPRPYSPRALSLDERKRAREDLLAIGDVHLRGGVVGEASLRRWSTRYGPLGLLLHRTVQVVLDRAPPPEADDLDRSWMGLMRVTGKEIPPGWRARRWTSSLHLGAAWSWDGMENGGAREADVDVSKEPVHHFATPPGMLARRLDSRRVISSLDLGFWGRFFPGIAFDSTGASYPDPGPAMVDVDHPGWAEFWTAYAEPLEDFLEAAAILRNAVVAAARNPERINALAERASPQAELHESGSLHFHWRSSTMFGALAAAALGELLDGLRCFECAAPGCISLVQSKHPAARFCDKHSSDQSLRVTLRRMDPDKRAADNARRRALYREKKGQKKPKERKR